MPNAIGSLVFPTPLFPNYLLRGLNLLLKLYITSESFFNLINLESVQMKVIVYSTRTCPWCVKVKDFLKENNVEFKEIYVDEDHEAAKKMVEDTGQMGVPVTEIGEQFVIGYDVSRLKELLKLK